MPNTSERIEPIRRLVRFVGVGSPERLDDQMMQDYRRLVGSVALVGSDYHDDQLMYQGMANSANHLTQSGMLNNKDRLKIHVLFPDRDLNSEVHQRMLAASDFLASLMQDRLKIRVDADARPHYMTRGPGSERIRAHQALHHGLAPQVNDLHQTGYVSMVRGRWSNRVFTGYSDIESTGRVAVLRSFNEADPHPRWRPLIDEPLELPMHD